ncbi:glycerol-3-phosphate 1-O-acyltransferase [Psychromonas sp. psych-6C06]|uniref:glycerol-3-phosphate 1-O-acyltransferase PlsB n=1 Tax=Psychromonas sp. psych-6C06 TaxID=2058089 RepID=UPI000C33F4BB|nr:glycerol-3-phosphate 1-O-acyltransferase PlsB [Psychromonas sp. psych-6C06]PKF61505.1 glycerol-3-phosphate 1-O-acyltransferase [Psychromonas sp. psych-6C06]
MLAKGSLFSRIINRLWVKSQHVPTQAIQELSIDLDRPVIYVVEQNNASDLLGLQASCKKAGLPDPYQPITVNGVQISALVYLHNWSLFAAKAPQLQDAPYLEQYQQLLDLHNGDESLDIQLIPVTFYWGRNPGRDGKKSWFDLTQQGQVGLFHKSLVVLRNGKDHLVRFNQPISIKKLILRSNNKPLAYKLAKVAMRYFDFQKRSSIGPKLPNRKQMIETVLAQAQLRKVIINHAETLNLSEDQVEQQCRAYLNEISTNFSYSFMRFFRLFLSAIWNFIYQGIEVNHAQAVRQACQSGAEIIYMPCHRSHMDYLLLSYLLFEQGVVPPHVAAGVNLNFFPAGPIFRRSGAFFLRRTFKDDPLYAEVFNAYFSMLFKQGYPIEFFTEGGRSRTGLLLEPKTGLLSTSLKTYLRQPDRNVVIVPIYIGYDHIMEVNTYINELAGQKKERESVWQLLGIVKKLGNFGRAFVNFGEPINVKQHFDQYLPGWSKSEISDKQFKQQVTIIAQQVMTNINAATAVNALPLCAAILLANKNHQVDKNQFLEQLKWHQKWLSTHEKGSLVTYPKNSGDDLLTQALAQHKFQCLDDCISCSAQQALALDYYKNNIVHLFVLPSLIFHAIAHLTAQKQFADHNHILECCRQPYLQLQKKYFLPHHTDAYTVLEKTITSLLTIDGIAEKSGQYIVLDELLARVMEGHISPVFDNPSIAI